ncbi:MAG: tRNA (guanine(37)-N1)-methyltransferase Trm5b [Candidatus Methanofastidiosum methylothiophilum]|uniref:tRNA (guanine(37)-N(1))-methyltransferase n=1 Tax=Candidatus Methanofastidiosum methylothiophilum TaxID=1705564 RepID=A0A150IVX5_9EURY|nr:MAG: tRNA (guanine(37)-N1)-methyltransferase Trm5b [Candidatus Methanofastidiosum methylthiophilus]KYC46622.1 MAG: tRNA (guanine(37)-N1)-methyltransferase Trm5b [Candidatus Methanofastidiosum methylthiophilus]KYC49110.1 MAG: tRNA (guanine(37)-N1)-methyltransferase Trm5b [Candidatus Methanofastidiosum methylthiophilus]
MPMIGARVSRAEGEKHRKTLLDRGVLDINFKIAYDGDFIIFPLKEEISGYDLVEYNFLPLEKRKTSIREILSEKIPESYLLKLRAFDAIGNIALIQLSDELISYQKIIGEALLELNPFIKCVFRKDSIEGKYRVPKLELIAGEYTTETVYQEFGVRILLDVSKVYFSPRLSEERKRIASLVKKDETILDMFCGVGPFSLMISKKSNPKKIYAIDINEAAIYYLKKNIALNKTYNIVPIHGDSRKEIKNIENPDRIIMNLPHSSFEFLPDVFSTYKSSIVHLYAVSENINSVKKKIIELSSENNKKIEFITERTVKSYSPNTDIYCIDFAFS